MEEEIEYSCWHVQFNDESLRFDENTVAQNEIEFFAPSDATVKQVADQLASYLKKHNYKNVTVFSIERLT